uniref:Nucleolar complex associated 4 homolog n=1 Tax=Anas platyrhynchos platyrhynchos TaxID=8840 RepID=U3I135_ANAPP
LPPAWCCSMAQSGLAACLEAVLGSRGNANRVYELLERLADEDVEEVLGALRACGRLFGALLERGELFVGRLPAEEAALAGSAEEKYRVWMRHRYNDCVVVDGLIPLNEDASLLISRFQEYMEYDDIRYFVMKAVTESIGQRPLPFYQQNIFSLISPINMPNKEIDLVKFMVKQAMCCCCSWSSPCKGCLTVLFCPSQLPTGLYKKVLVILHDSILPYMNEPTLMIDFLTVAYGIGGAISLLALNGLFILIHQHNLEYPDFYKKLYSLLDPSIYHVKYRALTTLLYTHLPAYLVAAFIKRLSRLALTAPPEALLMVIPFICNLFRRHPACKVLVHRPNGPGDLSEDPYIMEQEEPSESRALESSLWELQSLQNHYHPDVARAAAILNQSLSEIEDDISGLLELSASELFDKEVKKSAATVPLEFEQVRGLFGKKNDIFAEHFSLD